jgi:cytochrome c oxidase cbb3-type subunit I/II
LLADKLDTDCLPARIMALRRIGVPYPAGYETRALAELKQQAAKVATNLKVGSITAEPDREIIAVIAYLQRLGTDIKLAPKAAAVKTAELDRSSQARN